MLSSVSCVFCRPAFHASFIPFIIRELLLIIIHDLEPCINIGLLRRREFTESIQCQISDSTNIFPSTDIPGLFGFRFALL